MFTELDLSKTEIDFATVCQIFQNLKLEGLAKIETQKRTLIVDNKVESKRLMERLNELGFICKIKINKNNNFIVILNLKTVVSSLCFFYIISRAGGILSSYLTEKRLGMILANLLPEENFIHDRSVPESKNRRRRPDFRNIKMKLIIEFDGDSHYCKASRIISDKEKDKDYSDLGYRVVRIPYFVQMNTKLLQYIFGGETHLVYQQEYKHGFIDKKAVLPADFCELGIKAFENVLKEYKEFSNEIIESIKEKIEELGDINLVLPTSLHYLINSI